MEVFFHWVRVEAACWMKSPFILVGPRIAVGSFRAHAFSFVCVGLK